LNEKKVDSSRNRAEFFALTSEKVEIFSYLSFIQWLAGSRLRMMEDLLDSNNQCNLLFVEGFMKVNNFTLVICLSHIVIGSNKENFATSVWRTGWRPTFLLFIFTVPRSRVHTREISTLFEAN